MSTLVLALLSLATAQEPSPGAPAPRATVNDEVIVYADDFARWDDTRWLVQSELILPMGMTFLSDRNQEMTSYGLQMRAVIRCGKDGKLSKRKIEVLCEIEDIGILATSLRRWRGDRDQRIAQMILDEVDAKLTGAQVQLQTDKKGGVPGVDIEGVHNVTNRQRIMQETLRQLTSRLVSGFHLKIPDHAQREEQVIEYNSELMRLPSLTSSRGTTTMVHQVTVHPGYQLVQTVGEGVATVKVPIPESLSLTSSASEAAAAVSGGPGGSSGAVGEVNTGELPAAGSGRQSESSTEMTFKLEATGVAVFEKETGIMTERVWNAWGVQTASSMAFAGSQGLGFRNMGRITMLGPDDRPDVGPTQQVSWPKQGSMEGLPAWVPIEVMPK